MRCARLTLLPALLLAACTESSEQTETRAQALSPAPVARLVNVREIARGDALEPRLSPDGRFVAFTAAKYEGIRVASVEGGPVSTLTTEAGAGFRFAWSPDSARIAYATRELDGASLLRVVAREGGQPRTVHRAEAGAPLPLPRFDERGELLFVDGARLRAEGRGPATESLPSPRLSGHSRKLNALVLAGDKGIFLAEPDGAHARALLPGREFFEFALSPGGESMLARELTAGGGNLWAVDLESGKRTLLPGFDRGCILPSGRIVAERLEGDGLQLTRGELWLLEARGDESLRLEGAGVAVPYRVDCALGSERIAFGDDATDSVLVADLEVAR